MKLVIMKQKHLDAIKSSLESIYTYYYSNSTNDWMQDLCGENPFVEFGEEIPKFELASLDEGKSAGEIDFENCKIIYENLKFLSESQASDERLWAGLCNSTFYDYMRRRGKYDTRKPLEKEKGAGEIKSRFFFKSGKRSGYYRNTLAKCWWVGKAMYDPKNQYNHFERLDILGPNDMSTKVSDIFHNYTFSSNSEILDGIVDCYKHYNDEGIKISVMNHVRKALQHLNAVGGGIILDCLSREEIAQELIDYIDMLLQGEETEANYTTSLEDDDIDDSFDNQEENQDNQPDEVILGTLISIKSMDNGDIKRYMVSYTNDEFPEIVSESLGKKIGDQININGKEYKLIDIKLNRK